MTLPDGPALEGPQLFEAFFANPATFLHGCYETYGDLFTLNLGTFNIDRFGASGAWVFLCDADHMKTVFRTAGILAGAANAIQFQQLFPPEASVMLDGPEHLERRRTISRLMQGEKKLRSFTDTIHRLVLDEVRRFPPAESFTLAPRLGRIVGEVMRHLSFGPIANDDTARIGDLVADLGCPAHSTEERLKIIADCGDVLLKMKGEHEACPHATSDEPTTLFSLLMLAQENGASLQDRQIIAEMVTLLVGGSDTTATTLTWVMAWLLSNESVLAQVQDEIQRVLGDRAPRAEDIDQLEYLDAVIKEACRLSPMLPTSAARLLREPLVLGEYCLPAGTILASCPSVIHTRPDYYENPLEFDPTRFIGVAPDPHRWLPFGGGIRRCIGMTFALYEMKLIVASILQSTRFEPVDVRTTAASQGSFFGPAGGVGVRVGA